MTAHDERRRSLSSVVRATPRMRLLPDGPGHGTRESCLLEERFLRAARVRATGSPDRRYKDGDLLTAR